MSLVVGQNPSTRPETDFIFCLTLDSVKIVFRSLGGVFFPCFCPADARTMFCLSSCFLTMNSRGAVWDRLLHPLVLAALS